MTDSFDMILQRGFVIFIITTVITIFRNVLFLNIVVQSIFTYKSELLGNADTIKILLFDKNCHI